MVAGNSTFTLSRRVRIIVQRSKPLAGQCRRLVPLNFIALSAFVALGSGSTKFGNAEEHHRSTGKCIEAGDVLRGQPVDDVRLGIRPSPMAKSGDRLRHGDWLRYEVWIRNENDMAIHIPRDPRVTLSPLLKDKAVNLVGLRSWASFDVPLEQLDEAVLTLGPQEASLLLLLGSSQAPVRPAGTERGRFGPQPLGLAPGAYPCLAELDLYYFEGGIHERGRRDGKSIHLRSEVAMVQVLPAARLRIHETNKVTARANSALDAYPGKETISWSPAPGVNEHLIINHHSEPLLDEDDIIDAFAAPAPDDHRRYDIHLHLNPDAGRRLAHRAEQLLGKPIVLEIDGFLTSPKSIWKIDDGEVVLTDKQSKEQAASTVQAIKSRLRDKAQPKQPDSPGKNN